MVDGLWVRAVLLAIIGCVVGIRFEMHVLGWISLAAAIVLAIVVVAAIRETEQAILVVNGIQLASFVIPMWIAWLGARFFA
jgi:hypothetical protein